MTEIHMFMAWTQARMTMLREERRRDERGISDVATQLIWLGIGAVAVIAIATLMFNRLSTKAGGIPID